MLFSRANLVESEDGKKTLLSSSDPNQRHAIAKRLLTPSDSSLPLSQCKKVTLSTISITIIIILKYWDFLAINERNKTRILQNSEALIGYMFFFSH